MTRASFAQRVALVCMLCQFSIDELEAAARVISGRSHRMAARRRRMVRNGSPTGRLRSRAVQTLCLAFRVLRVDEWTSTGRGALDMCLPNYHGGFETTSSFRELAR